MVSQSAGPQDSPADSWEWVTHDSGDVDGSPGLLDTGLPPCPSDMRPTRHKAAWINPQHLQQQLQDLPPGVPIVGDAATPSGTFSLPPENATAETSLRKDTVVSVGSSGAKRSNVSSTSVQEQAVAPGRTCPLSLCTSAQVAAALRCPEADGARRSPPCPAAPTGEGAVQVSGRSISLNSVSLEAFILPVDVEKENAHFYAADMIISAMEKMKCDILNQQPTESWSGEEASGPPGNGQGDSEVTFCPIVQQESGSSASSDSGCEGCAVLQVSPAAKTPASCDVTEAWQCDPDDFVIIEPGEFSSTRETGGCSCGSSQRVTYEPDFNSAERIAKELYQVFRKCWVLPEANHQLVVSLSAAGSIVVNEEHFRKDFESSVDLGEEIKFKSKIRGTEHWAPPRFQVIFHVHPPLKRELVVAAQNFFCAGCGTPVEPRFVKRLRYCEYLGKYFCDCCHSYAEACIPARILTLWDFKKYHVSNFAKRLLEAIWSQPVFSLPSLGHGLSAKAKELDRVREIQEQLFHIKKLLKTCRFAESTLKEFEQVPRHLTDELYLFSLEDLVRVKKRLLAPLLKDILKASLAHVAGCELCQGKGFICEFCQSTAVIFPFQTATCTRCSECRACFHRQCFQSVRCPRCARISARRRLLEDLPSAGT